MIRFPAFKIGTNALLAFTIALSGTLLATSPASAAPLPHLPPLPIKVVAIANAVAGGTEVTWTPGAVGKKYLAPTGFVVASCGPFLFGSAELSAAIDARCAGKLNVALRKVKATANSTIAHCMPTATYFCVISVQSVSLQGTTKLSSAFTPAIGSGGKAPNPVASVSAVPAAGPSGIVLSWLAGADVAQEHGIPTEAVTYEVAHNGKVLASRLTGLTFIDPNCAPATSCTDTVTVVNAGGRSTPALVTGISRGTTAPTLSTPPVLLVPGRSALSGKLGSGVNDPRPVQLKLLPTAVPSGASPSPVTLNAISSGDHWNLSLPGSVPPGTYSLTAMQFSNGSSSLSVSVALPTPLQGALAGSSTSHIATVAGMAAALQGQGTPSAPASPISIQEVRGLATPTGSAPSQTAMAAAVASAPASKKSAVTTASVAADGSWSAKLPEYQGRGSFHIVKMSQSVPGSAASTWYAAFSVAATGAPDAPVISSANAGNGTATVTWTTPPTNGFEISSYRVTASPGDETCTLSTLAGNLANSCDLTGLVNGTSYSFSVTASNEAGDGPASLSSGGVVPRGPPNAPNSVTVAPGLHAVTVIWTPGSSSGSPVSSYTVTTVDQSSRSCSYRVPRKNELDRCTIAGLSAGEAHQYVVTATNELGNSLDSDPSSATAAFAEPDAPSAVAVTMGDRQATVSWTPGASNGQPIISFKASVTGFSNLACTYTVPNSGPETDRCTITGLKNGTPYNFSVTANSLAGTSLASSDWVQGSPAPLPLAPTGLQVDSLNGALRVHWAAPSSDAAYVTGYIASAGSQSCSVDLNYNQTYSCTITGLKNGTRYSVSVTATNWTGSSPSTTIQGVPAGPPGSPGEISVGTLSDSGTPVSWSPPSDNGGAAILSYTVSVGPDGSYGSCSYLVPKSGPELDRCLVPSLGLGSVLDFSVVATNIQGSSEPSILSEVRIATLPPAPSSLNVNWIRQSTAELAWTLPLGFRGGDLSSASSFTVTSSPAGHGCTIPASSNLSGLCEISGLDPTVAYTFTGHTTNSKGAGPSTAATPPVTAWGPPLAPTDVSVLVDPAAQTALVTWKASPSLQGGSFKAYRALVNGVDNCIEPPSEGPSGTYSCTVDGLLRSGDHYNITVEVQSQGPDGVVLSATSSPPVQVVNPDVPAPMDPPSVIAVHDGLAISWTPASGRGSPVSSYEVVAKYFDKWNNASVVPACTYRVPSSGPEIDACVTSSLSPATVYYFSVIATNAVGPAAWPDWYGYWSSGDVFESAPSVPTNITARVSSSGTVSVSWDPSANPGTLRYGVTYTETAYDANGDVAATCSTLVSCSFDSLTIGEPYTFDVVASNTLWTSAPSERSAPIIPIGRPQPPTDLKVITDHGQATITLRAPVNNGGSPVTWYHVAVEDGYPRSGTCLIAGGAAPLSCTIDGLIDGLQYTFAAFAINVEGFSDWTAATDPVIPGGIPDPPGASWLSGADSSIVVRWIPPSGVAGSVATSFIATASPGQASCKTASTSCTIQGLVNGATYTVSVIGRNQAGDSGATNLGTAQPAGPPAAPNHASLAASPNAIAVNWTAADAQGSALTAYWARAYDGETMVGGCHTDGDGTGCKITGLSNGVTYRVAVTAENNRGSSPELAAGTATPLGLPSAPSSLRALSIFRGALVSWLPGDNGGTAITNYHVVASPGGASCNYQPPRLGAETDQCNISGLVGSTAYSFSVTATNSIGDSPAASTSIREVADVPTKPAGVVLTGADASISATWENSLPRGADVISYRTDALPTTALASLSDSAIAGNYAGLLASFSAAHCTVSAADALAGFASCTLSGLANGTSYVLLVVATNANGTSVPLRSSAITPAAVPSAPVLLYATPGDRSIAVSWWPSDARGTPVTSYVVTATPGPVTCSVLVSETSATNCSLGGLNNGTSYAVSVVAHSAAGDSLTSLSSNVLVTPIPSAPSLGTPVDLAGMDRVQVSGSAPITGLAISSELIRAYPSDAYNAALAAGGATLSSFLARPSDSCRATPSSDGSFSCSLKAPAVNSWSFVAWASNAAGQGPASSAAVITTGRPGPVVGLRATQATANSISLSWGSPIAPGAAPVTRYTVTEVGSGLTCSYSPPKTGPELDACTVTGLATGSAHSFDVVATNKVGQSDSVSSDPLTLTSASAAPTSAVATVLGAGSVTLAWTAPTGLGASAVTSYLVTAVSTTGSMPSTCRYNVPSSGVSLNRCTITGLAAGLNYDLWVVAASPFGTSAPSISVRALVTGPPGQPSVTVVSAGEGNAWVAWNPPAVVPVPAITSYSATAVEDPTRSCSSSGGFCLVTGLSDGVTYHFTVTATNASGAGPASEPSNAVVPSGVPSAPIISSSSAGDGFVDLTWSAAQAHGFPVLRYQAQSVEDPSRSCTVDPVDGSSDATCRITGLGNGTSYHFTVTAVNAMGESAASVPSGMLSPRGAPDPANNLLVVAGDRTATLTWSAPSSLNGAQLTSYEVSSVPPSSSCTIMVTGSELDRCVLSSMENGTNYQLVLRANSPSGSSRAYSQHFTPVGPPEQPDAPRLIAGDGQLAVAWISPGYSNGLPIDRYRASVEGDPSHSCSATGGDGYCVITGLTNGTSYAITLTATNSVGSSVASRSASATPAGPPDAPVITSASAGDGSIKLSWTSGASHGSVEEFAMAWLLEDPSRSCTVMAGETQSCTITGLRNASSYHATVASYFHGEPSWVQGWSAEATPSAELVPAGAPLTSATISASARDASVQVTWAPADANGSAISSYTVETKLASFDSSAMTWSYSPAIPPGCTLSDPAQLAAPSCTITGLHNGWIYAFFVTATNAFGSVTFTSPVAQPFAAPDTPAITAVVTSARMATISVLGGSDNGSPQSFTVSDTRGAFSCNAVPINGGRFAQCVVDHLQAGSNYRFTATATNVFGSSAASAASEPVLIQTAPDAPSISSVEILSSSSVRVHLSPGAGNGSVVTSMTARILPISYGSNDPNPYAHSCTVVVSNPPEASSSCDLTSLSSGYSYVAVAIATNAIGNSVDSAWSDHFSPMGVPGIPSLGYLRAGIGTATVTWYVPRSNGSAITSFTLTADQDPSVTATLTAADLANPTPLADPFFWGRELSWTFTGLDGSEAWSFHVSATNAAGDSPDSASSNAMIPGAAPSAPRIASATLLTGSECPSGTCLAVSWLPASANGSPIISYTATDTSAAGAPSCIANVSGSGPEPDHCVISGLRQGLWVDTITVAAINSLGTSPEVAAWAYMAPTPAIPDGVHATAGGTSALVSWSSSGSQVSAYDVQVADHPEFGCQSSGAISCRVYGLTAGSSYRFVVRAGNSAGWSEFSTPSESLLVGSTPAAPTTVVATATAAPSWLAGPVDVTWMPPSDNGGFPVLRYEVRELDNLGRVVGSGCSYTVPASGEVDTCRVAGTFFDRAYRFDVRAVSILGFGARSVLSNPVVAHPLEPSISDPVDGSVLTTAKPMLNGLAALASRPVLVETKRNSSSPGADWSTWVQPNSDGSFSVLLRGPNGLLTDGSWTVLVAQNLPTDRDSWATSLSLQVDTTAPNLQLAAQGPGDSAQSICGTAGTAGRDLPSVSLIASLGDFTINTTVEVPSNGSFCLPASVDGSWNVTLSQADSVGNIATTTGTVLVDDTGPSPTLTPPSSTDDSPRWASVIQGFAGTANGDLKTLHLVLARSNCVNSCTASVDPNIADDGSWSVRTDGFADGIWSVVSLAQSDQAGNLVTVRPDPADLSASFVVDHTVPTAPVLVATAGQHVGLLGCQDYPLPHNYRTTVTVTRLRNGGGDPATWSVLVPSPPKCTDAAGIGNIVFNLGASDPTLLPTGSYLLSARTADSAGRSASSAYLSVQSVADPTTTVAGLSISGADATTASALVPGLQLNGTATTPLLKGVGASLTLSFAPQGSPSWFTGSTSIYSAQVSVPVADDGTWSWTIPTTFPDANYLVSASQQTPLGAIISSPLAVSILAAPSSLLATKTTVTRTAGSSQVSLALQGGLAPQRMVASASLVAPASSAKPCNAKLSPSNALVPTGWNCGLSGSFGNGTLALKLTTSYFITWTSCATATSNFDNSCSAVTATQMSTSDLSQFIVTSVPAPQLSSPLTTTLNRDGSVADSNVALTNTFTVTGTGSLSSADASTVTVKAYPLGGDGIPACNCLGSAALPLITNLTAFANWKPKATATANLNGGSFSTNLTLPDGRWQILVVQADSTGQIGSSAISTVVVDSTGPVITPTWPPEAAIIPSAFVGAKILRGWGATSLSSSTPDVTISYYRGGKASGSPALVDNLHACVACQSAIADAPALATGDYTAVISAVGHNSVSSSATVHFTVNAATATAQPTSLQLSIPKNWVDTGGSRDWMDSPPAGPGTVVVVAHTGGGGVDSPAPTGNVSLTLTAGKRISTYVGDLVNGQVSIPVVWSPSSFAGYTQVTAKLTASPGYAASSSAEVAAPWSLTPNHLDLGLSFPRGRNNPGTMRVRLSAIGSDGSTVSCNPAYVGLISINSGFNWTLQKVHPELDANSQPTGWLVMNLTQASFAGSTGLWDVSVNTSGDDRCGDYSYSRGTLGPSTKVDFGAGYDRYFPRIESTCDLTPGGCDQGGATSLLAVGQLSRLRVNVLTFLGGMLTPAVGIPVWLLGPDGKPKGEAVYTDARGSAWVPWTPDHAGWLSPEVQVDSCLSVPIPPCMTTEARAVPVEPAPVSLTPSFMPSEFAVGQDALTTVSISPSPADGSGSQFATSGKVSMFDRFVTDPAEAPDDGVTPSDYEYGDDNDPPEGGEPPDGSHHPGPSISMPISCAANCTATAALPDSIINDPVLTYAPNDHLYPSVEYRYISGATGLSYVLDVVAPRVITAAAPIKVSVAPSSADLAAAASVSVQWVPSGSGNYTYTATANPGGASCTTTGRSCTISNLNPAIAVSDYSYRVSAVDTASQAAAPAPMGISTTPLALAPGSTTRDEMKNVTIKLSPQVPNIRKLNAFKNLGTLYFQAGPNCSDPRDARAPEYCSRMVSRLKVNLQDGKVTVLQGPIGPAAANDPTQPGPALLSFAPSVSARWVDGSLVVSASIFQGAQDFVYQAHYEPTRYWAAPPIAPCDICQAVPNIGWSVLAPSSDTLTLNGVGDLPATVKLGHAVAMGGMCNDPSLSFQSPPVLTNWCRFTNVAPLVDPMITTPILAPGDTAYVVVQCDPVLCSVGDTESNFALIEANPAGASFISSNTTEIPEDPNNPGGQFTYAAGGALTDIADTKSLDGGPIGPFAGDSPSNPSCLDATDPRSGVCLTRSYGPTVPYACSSCAIFSISSLSSSNPYADGGGLGIGRFEMSLMPYSLYVAGSTMGSAVEMAGRSTSQPAIDFPIEVDPTPTDVTATAGLLTGLNPPDLSGGDSLAYTACTDSDCPSFLEVVASANVPDLAASRSYDPAETEFRVMLKHAGALHQIADCTGVGICTDWGISSAADDGSMATLIPLPPAVAIPLGKSLQIQVDVGALVASGSLAIGDSIDVLASSPYGIDAAASDITIAAASAATPASAGSITGTGVSLGATLDTPDLSPPAGAFSWDMYHGEMSFFSFIFGASAAHFFTVAANQLVQDMILSAFLGPFGPEGAAAFKALSELASAAVRRTASAVAARAATLVRTVMSRFRSESPGLISRLTAAGRSYVQRASRSVSDSVVGRGFRNAQGAIERMMANQSDSLASTMLKAGCYVGSDFFRAGKSGSAARYEVSSGTSCTAVAKTAALTVASLAGTDGSDAGGFVGEVGPVAKEIWDWKSHWKTKVTALIASQPEAKPGGLPADNVGMGRGVALEFTQYFAAVINAQVPGWGTGTTRTLTIDLMDQPSIWGGRYLSTLGSCTEGQTLCSGVDSMSIVPLGGELLLNGIFPQDVAWIPPGAWLRITATEPDGTTYTGRVDVRFPGYSLSSKRSDGSYYRDFSPPTWPAEDPYYWIWYNLLSDGPTAMNAAIGELMYTSHLAQIEKANLTWTATTASNYDPLSNGGVPWPN